MSFKQLIVIASLLTVISCTETGLYEKVVFMQGNEWSNAQTPEFNFEIKDTSTNYLVYFLFRHADAYEYNNVWIKLKSQLPGDSVARTERFDIPLAANNRWLGSGMDDIFDHRVLLYKEPVRFIKPGNYTIQISHDMRIEPVNHVFNVGLRLEKQK
jgi:gliding motility-associated lipoprotein GldH